jgi:hypothetical protein
VALAALAVLVLNRARALECLATLRAWGFR